MYYVNIKIYSTSSRDLFIRLWNSLFFLSLDDSFKKFSTFFIMVAIRLVKVELVFITNLPKSSEIRRLLQKWPGEITYCWLEEAETGDSHFLQQEELQLTWAKFHTHKAFKRAGNKLHFRQCLMQKECA